MTSGRADLFTRINNAVLDLQRADYQTYQKPLKDIARLLRHADLAAINAKLTAAVDVEAFLKGQGPRGGMIGGDVLDWPEDPDQVLGGDRQLLSGHCSCRPSTKLFQRRGLAIARQLGCAASGA